MSEACGVQCVVTVCLLLARGIVPSRPRQSTESRVDTVVQYTVIPSVRSLT